jgi:hypothetical protein
MVVYGPCNPFFQQLYAFTGRIGMRILLIYENGCRYIRRIEHMQQLALVTAIQKGLLFRNIVEPFLCVSVIAVQLKKESI